jgi:hypothetical protein
MIVPPRGLEHRLLPNFTVKIAHVNDRSRKPFSAQAWSVSHLFSHVFCRMRFLNPTGRNRLILVEEVSKSCFEIFVSNMLIKIPLNKVNIH